MIEAPAAPARPAEFQSSAGSGWAIASLVAGCAGIVLPGMGLLLGALGLAAGIVGREQARLHGNRRGEALGRVGIYVSIAAMVITVVAAVVVFVGLWFLFANYSGH